MSAQTAPVDSVFDTEQKTETPAPSNFISEEMKKIEDLFTNSKAVEEENSRLKEENVRLKEDQARLKEDQARLKEDQARLKEDQARLKEDHERLKKECEEMKENQTNVDWLNAKVREVMFRAICNKLPNLTAYGYGYIGFTDIRIVHYNVHDRTQMIFSYNNDSDSLRLVVKISLRNAELLRKKGFTFEKSDSETIYGCLPDTCVQICKYGSGWTFEVIPVVGKQHYGFYKKELGAEEYPFDITPEIPRPL